MGFDDDVCNTGLGLGLLSCHENQKKKKTVSLTSHLLVPSLTLGPSEDTYQSCLSTVSSFSNSGAVKKEKELGNCEDVEVEVEAEAERVVCSRVSDEEEEGSPRKKLRLTKQQSAILEDSFKEHSNLNPKQKQALANQLNLRPRQVEVWFQNRRARTKLKQTEVDCELLKKCCETLKEENQRLQKELQELKSLKLMTPLYMKLPVATLTMCPSCEKVGGASDGSTPNVFSIGPKPHLYSSFTTHQSAAC